MHHVHLLCLPFAGAGASIYRSWSALAPHINVLPVQLPGREQRFIEEAHRDAHTAADALAQEVQPRLTPGVPVALFGHSMGAVLAYELTRRLLDRHVPVQHLWVSGSPSPWAPRAYTATGLTDEAFLARVSEFAGYTHEALQDPDMRALLLPTLRADVELHEQYRPQSDQPLAVPVTALRGATDELVSAEDLLGWQRATTQPLTAAELPGGHMYFLDDPAPLLDRLTQQLLPDSVPA
ncbi:alpha/beta fold hydrolase [Deinococcus sp. HMF7604]|uniref:thioesterase II family protein n=1 Tax=Deinococcus betulae TaxID=2873312 RepID=UPI001CC95F51|nr:alpha/beta fold hydrolase [Deinococcus betulae]MBZ9752282.1 alpha/beta fold hydrolase [Deinococcus betulae]